jgi:metal-responsive CopG/Arc/MetJ family transcriptional regulator
MGRKKLKEEDKKRNLTISIDNDIYENLNRYVVDKDINRSKLIEKLLKEYIENNSKE